MVGGEQVGEMCAQLIVAVGMKAFDGCCLDGAGHSLDVASGPRVVELAEPMLDPVGFTDHVEAHPPRIDVIPVWGQLCEMNTVISENGIQLIGRGGEEVLQELPRLLSVSR